jgi:TRAP-type mannitol/chloroaromatic compound transport system substrate-binding protein
MDQRDEEWPAMDRRRFVRNAGAIAGLGALSACAPQDCSNTAGPGGDRLEWKMVTSWPRNFPGLGTGANRLAEAVTRMSGGRLTVKVFGANDLVPPFEVFDAVSRGTAEMGHSAAYYWKGKAEAAQFFGGVPFGLNGQEMNAWMYYGGGLELWQRLYADFNLVPFPGGNSGVQMGGWFNKEINSAADLEGLKMRIPGLGGEVLKRAGGTPVTLPGAELFTALKSGAIDATEWVGPFNDLAFGLFQAARYYYYPGWHEPGSTLELMVNKTAFDALPEDLRSIVEHAAKSINVTMLSEFTARNGRALKTLIEEHNVEVRRFPEEVLSKLAGLSDEVVAEAAKDDLGREILASLIKFRDESRAWHEVSEVAYYQARG